MTANHSASPHPYWLPQVEQLLQQDTIQPCIEAISRPVVTGIIRQVLADIRRSEHFKTQGGQNLDITGMIVSACENRKRDRQSRVLNATGIIVHTNLGRSPVDPQLWQQVTELNTGYCNLEMSLHDGKRGMRNGLLPTLIHHWTGAEDALIVNNNAAAVYLILTALASGKEVIVSRGEQVQIGGGFRIPDILAQSGCRLVEVGTTNITTAEDYLNAVTDDTALVLMVHQSNFSIQGFTEAPDIREVAKNLPQHVRLVVDQGSGLSDETYAEGETSLRQYLNQGVDLVCCSGDKIPGGPQAGIIAGKAELIRTLAKHPMMRAFRPGRIVLSLLEALLVEKLNRSPAGEGIAERLIRRLPELENWADELAERWAPYARKVMLETQVGGGSVPSETYAAYGLVLDLPGKPQSHLAALRQLPVPVIGYIRHQQLYLNLSTLLAHDREMFTAQLSDYLDGLSE
ncbi:L-seryl-tRNA(Sec) selenium transferase [Vibrio quintilis]|uniref:L-seryl-tRNA(Sec) selenium transferase n=1 Tax=Vibrio quintilis TaxID=1117707 RepID=A0A1M7YNV6_9VIBR|nr:L-seryl-tRNA(Sec) selenium transferase [Vibrio quintilis]SHO54322.1 L-seryl-tRNA(Sec) selenium transferase [Vibrio quintilis]